MARLRRRRGTTSSPDTTHTPGRANDDVPRRPAPPPRIPHHSLPNHRVEVNKALPPTAPPPSLRPPALTLWPNKSTPSELGRPPGNRRPKHHPIDISQYKQPSLPAIRELQHDLHTSSHAPRLGRHVPILIPSFANPLSPSIDSPATADDSRGSPLPPRLEPQTRQAPAPLAKGARGDPGRATFEAHYDRLIREIHADMNNSQTSLAASDASADQPNGTPQVAASPAVQQASTSAQTNLSGLVCNVHRTTGREPHALVGATTTILGDKLYVCGGRILSRRRPHLTSDVYELDLIRRHWTKLEVTGDVPPPRYFHSMCALGDTKLVCYGGMSPSPQSRQPPASGAARPTPDPLPEVVVMSDLHILDVHTRVWTQITAPDTPQGRYAHCATILPSSAVFTSADAPHSAVHHNLPSSDPHSGTLGVQIDGTGGAEMMVVGGQDGSNHYIEQISVFNLRSLKWTATAPLSRQCGAYRSVVVPLTGMAADHLGRGPAGAADRPESVGVPPSMLIYSNYNFLDVKLELQVRHPDGSLTEQHMAGPVSPPGLRFPNGGIINNHLVISGTYITSTKNEYALWALDLKTLTWGRIASEATVFSQGSWNRGILWNRRNAFVVLGHRKRSIVEDYNHRRTNFGHMCVVELEAFGLYENPRRAMPTSGYASVSSPSIPASQQADLAGRSGGGGRPFSAAAEQLGVMALSLTDVADMDLVATGGERIPCNSQLLSRRWGPYFNQLLAEASVAHDTVSLSDSITLRPYMLSQASRNSSVTITPSIGNSSGTLSNNTTLTASNYPASSLASSSRAPSRATTRTLELADPTGVHASSRGRALYLPHTAQTIQLLLRYLYTSALPPVGSALCNLQTLCSLLQIARPYQIDGLLEATVERLHEVLDHRCAAAVFNAAAMAAGGGRGLSPGLASGAAGVAATGATAGSGAAAAATLDLLKRSRSRGELESTDEGGNGVGGSSSDAETGGVSGGGDGGALSKTNSRLAGLRIDTDMANGGDGGTASSRLHNTRQQQQQSQGTGSDTTVSTPTSASTSASFSNTDTESSNPDVSGGGGGNPPSRREPQRNQFRDVWTGDVSSVIGLQKRGLKGLMEARRERERSNNVTSNPNVNMMSSSLLFGGGGETPG